MTLDLAHVRRVEAENGRLKQRVEELEGDVKSLRSLLGEVPVRVPGTEHLHLTHLEQLILATLYTRLGMIVSKGSIHDAIYQLEAGDDVPGEKVVDVKLVALRRKLVETPYRIETIWGQGLRLVRTDNNEEAP